MPEVTRVTPEEVYPKLRSGEALLICAYDDDAKFRRHHLEGAMSLAEFKSLRPTLPRDREIVFYCAWPQEGSAAGQAAALIQAGYTNAKALKGGVAAWKEAGFPVVGE